MALMSHLDAVLGAERFDSIRDHLADRSAGAEVSGRARRRPRPGRTSVASAA